MKNIIVNCIEGYSASIRKEEDTLSSVLKPFIDEEFKDRVMCFNEMHSSKYKCIDKCAEFICSEWTRERNLLLVGKSLGAVKTYSLLKNYSYLLNLFDKVAVVFIDAHSPIFSRPCLIGNFRNLKLPKRWTKKGNLFYNVYQKNKYPKGCKVVNANCNTKLKNKAFNHWNIINSLQVKLGLLNAFNYLIT